MQSPGLEQPGEPRSAEEEFTALYREHWLAVLGYASRRVMNSADAVDVVAETFSVAWRRIDDVPAEPTTRPWLFGVARNSISNQARSLRRRSALIERLRSQVADVFETTAPRTSHVLVRDALDSIDPTDRELLTLTIWEGFTPTEIAESLDLPPGTVRSRLHRARAALRPLLEANGLVPSTKKEHDHEHG